MITPETCGVKPPKQRQQQSLRKMVHDAVKKFEQIRRLHWTQGIYEPKKENQKEAPQKRSTE